MKPNDSTLLDNGDSMAALGPNDTYMAISKITNMTNRKLRLSHDDCARLVITDEGESR